MLVSGQIFHHALALDALHEAKAVLDYGALSPNQVQRVGRELDRVELHLPDVWRTFLTLPACVGLGLTLAVVFTGRPLGRLNERLASD
jgi:acyl-coenzyme A synthetase/AMP-(fatty) acid ligase